MCVVRRGRNLQRHGLAVRNAASHVAAFELLEALVPEAAQAGRGGRKGTQDQSARPIPTRFRKTRRRVMGGIGSGRPGTGRGKVEACRSLDVNRLHREGCLATGWSGAVQWMQDKEQI